METSEPRSQSDSSIMSPKELASTCRSEEAVGMREGGNEGRRETQKLDAGCKIELRDFLHGCFLISSETLSEMLPERRVGVEHWVGSNSPWAPFLLLMNDPLGVILTLPLPLLSSEVVSMVATIFSVAMETDCVTSGARLTMF